MKKGIRPLAAAAALAAAAGMAGTAHAATGIDTNQLQKAVKVGSSTTGIRRHLKAFQEIADRKGNNGNRATATQGHEDSVKYVEQQLAGIRQVAADDQQLRVEHVHEGRGGLADRPPRPTCLLR